MSQEEKTESQVTTFSDEKSVALLKDIIKRLEAAQSLDEVKLIVDELETLLPTTEADADEVPESDIPMNQPILGVELAPGNDSTTVTVTEDGKTTVDKVAPALKSTIIDDPSKMSAEPVAEAPVAVTMSAEPVVETVELSQFKEVEGQLSNVTTQLSEVLGLNEKLITALKEAETEMLVLKATNSKLVEEKNMAEQNVSVFKAKLEQYETSRFQEKLKDIHAKWCSTFKLTSKEKQDEAFKMLSNFQSEDKLVEMSAYLSSLQPVKEVEQPLVMTQHTSTFKDVAPQKVDLSKLSPKERVEHLHQLYVNATRQ